MHYRKLTRLEKTWVDHYCPDDKYKYLLLAEIRFYSKKYDKWVICKPGMLSDGATGAMDIESESWWVHDELCATGMWSDGTACNNWQASRVISTILFREWKHKPFKRPVRGIRAVLWRPATWLFGGGAARKNGMW